MASPSVTTSSESAGRLGQVFARCRAECRAALIPFLPAGFPDRAASLAMLRATDAIADVIEIGVPFSDPVADGPVIQAASFRALSDGMSLAGTLALLAEARPTTPVVLFSYLNPVLQYGVDRLLLEAPALGIAGVLLTDLPVGVDPDLEARFRASPVDLIPLVAPTTPASRLGAFGTDERGFLYLVARLGVTGVSQQLAEGLAESVARVRQVSRRPIAVGFGISTPDQVRDVAELADGVIIGSALVERMGRDGVAPAAAWLASCRAALEHPR